MVTAVWGQALLNGSAVEYAHLNKRELRQSLVARWHGLGASEHGKTPSVRVEKDMRTVALRGVERVSERCQWRCHP